MYASAFVRKMGLPPGHTYVLVFLFLAPLRRILLAGIRHGHDFCPKCGVPQGCPLSALDASTIPSILSIHCLSPRRMMASWNTKRRHRCAQTWAEDLILIPLMLVRVPTRYIHCQCSHAASGTASSGDESPRCPRARQHGAIMSRLVSHTPPPPKHVST